MSRCTAECCLAGPANHPVGGRSGHCLSCGRRGSGCPRNTPDRGLVRAGWSSHLPGRLLGLPRPGRRGDMKISGTRRRAAAPRRPVFIQPMRTPRASCGGRHPRRSRRGSGCPGTELPRQLIRRLIPPIEREPIGPYGGGGVRNRLGSAGHLPRTLLAFTGYRRRVVAQKFRTLCHGGRWERAATVLAVFLEALPEAQRVVDGYLRADARSGARAAGRAGPTGGLPWWTSRGGGLPPMWT